MTRKEYGLIAKAMHATRPSLGDVRTKGAFANDSYNTWDDSITALCAALGAGNPRFDVEWFTEACCTGRRILA